MPYKKIFRKVFSLKIRVLINGIQYYFFPDGKLKILTIDIYVK